MSPEVWSAAKAIIADAATGLGVPIDMPNEDFNPPPPPSLWAAIDFGGDLSESLEIGGSYWIENGSIWVHVMIPLNIGIELALQYRKTFSVAFRADVPTVPGLYWREQSFDPLSPDDGVWRRLSLAIRYSFNDRLSDSQTATVLFAGSGSG